MRGQITDREGLDVALVRERAQIGRPIEFRVVLEIDQRIAEAGQLVDVQQVAFWVDKCRADRVKGADAAQVAASAGHGTHRVGADEHRPCRRHAPGVRARGWRRRVVPRRRDEQCRPLRRQRDRRGVLRGAGHRAVVEWPAACGRLTRWRDRMVRSGVSHGRRALSTRDALAGDPHRVRRRPPVSTIAWRAWE